MSSYLAYLLDDDGYHDDDILPSSVGSIFLFSILSCIGLFIIWYQSGRLYQYYFRWFLLFFLLLNTLFTVLFYLFLNFSFGIFLTSVAFLPGIIWQALKIKKDNFLNNLKKETQDQKLQIAQAMEGMGSMDQDVALFLRAHLQAEVPDMLIPEDSLQIQEVVAWGGSGVVFKGSFGGAVVAAKALLFNVQTATLKDLMTHEDFKDQGILHEMSREMRMLSKIRHPGVVSLYGVCIKNCKLLLVQEYCPQTLEKWVQKQEQEQEQGLQQRRLELMVSACATMSYLHQYSPPIAHRDLKPQNMLIDDHGGLKICGEYLVLD
jgi:hypothetical protein